ncbi:MAG TPA: ABC transporter ATP-binding protein [bacterium]|jgi:energy-coupling factor transporter ATP-binding protein EcfA2
MAELAAEQVTFGYDGAPLLRDISLTLRQGELTVCLGGNGSGKTTLLRLMSGLLTPAGGHVVVRGMENALPRQQTGMLFQNPDHQMLAGNVEEEIALGLELRGTPPAQIRETVEALLSRFQITSLRHHPPQALSGGQKQRVALAAIMAAKPRFLLLDEPDSFLDAPSRRELMSAVDEVRAECGILWMTPSPKRMPAADRHCLLRTGMLRECSREELHSVADAECVPR